MQWFKFAFSCRLTNDVKQNETFWYIFKWVCISQNSETVEVSKMTIRGEKVCGTPARVGPPHTTPACTSGGEHYQVITGPGLSLWIFPSTIHHTSPRKQNKLTRGILLTRWNLSKTERQELWKRLLKTALGLISDLPFIMAEEQGPSHDTDFIR